MELGDLECAVDCLVQSDPSSCADAESIESLQRQLARLEAFVTAATAAFDASGSGHPTAPAMPRRGSPCGAVCQGVIHGAWSAGAEPSANSRSAPRPGPTATSTVPTWTSSPHSAGRSPRMRWPVTRRCWLDRPAPCGSMPSPNDRLLGAVGGSRRGRGERADARRDRRDVYLESSFGGMWLGKITLDPISGAVVAGELGRLEREMFEADWAEAREALGREPAPSEVSRTSSQRRADALVEMATRSRTAPTDGRRSPPLFSVLVGYETLHGRICELVQGSVISPGSLIPWLDQATIERIVFRPGQRVEVSATARPFAGATRQPSSYEIGSAPIPTATDPLRSARSTTSSPSRLVARPRRRTEGCCAAPEPPTQPEAASSRVVAGSAAPRATIHAVSSTPW